MFFRKKDAEAAATAAPKSPASAVPRAQGDEDAQTSTVLDAIGGVISALARYPIDLPHRSAAVTAKDLTAWQRHATMGLPVGSDEDGSAVGIKDRDWRGLVREIAELRRDEQATIDSLVTELRQAIWSCVSAVHESVHIDDSATHTAESQMARMRQAVNGSQLSTIKAEVLSAVNEIEGALRGRREEQQRQYSSLASTLDSMGKQLEEAKKESATDPLTGVGNRKHFDVMSARSMQLFTLSRAPVTLLMIDMNKLKIINDSYGHQVGDAAIVSVAKALWKVFLRQSDVVCRYGGDEFAVVLNGTDATVAEKLAKRLVTAVHDLPLPDPSMEFALGISVGVAQLLHGETLADWIARADTAMYTAKKQMVGAVAVADARTSKQPSSQPRVA
jgi:diguanylate cyclase